MIAAAAATTAKMSKVMRSVRNVTKGYTATQVKVREATSNDAWGPTGTQMSEIAQLTFSGSTEFYEVMDMIDKRLNDKGKNWRHVLKALKVFDYCLHEGSEMVVTWAKSNIYIIKTLREFQYIDEDGRDVGQNVRVAAKELTSLILDEERMKAERTDRRSWKSRVTGLDEYGPVENDHSSAPPPRRQRERRNFDNDEDDAEYRLALEASKVQEEEDRRKREGRGPAEDVDDDLAKAIKLSKEEEDRRRRELEQTNASSLFDDDFPTTQQPQPTGTNQGYNQGNAVDFFANPIEQNQMQQPQPTGYMQQNMYTGYQMQQPNQMQQTGFQNGYSNGFGTQQTGMDPFGQQNQGFQPQATGYNPYAQQMQQQPQMQSPIQESPVQPGSNNPWATNNSQMAMKPMQTGSNNPFASQVATRPQTFKSQSTLSSLPEQKTLSSFQQQQQTFTPPPQPTFQQQQQPQKVASEHETQLNTLLASRDGQDTFGNTGNLRIPAQHTAPGTFVNSAGAGASRLTADATGNNPFLRTQFTGMPTVGYGGQQVPAATGPASMNNPFSAARPQQQQNNQGDLIQF